jgi:AhpD family alkylhydroperoxidase
VLALAASVTARSDYGVDFHLREARRLGLSEAGILEALQVTQMFNGFTKIADALRLHPDDFEPALRPRG